MNDLARYCIILCDVARLIAWNKPSETYIHTRSLRVSNTRCQHVRTRRQLFCVVYMNDTPDFCSPCFSPETERKSFSPQPSQKHQAGNLKVLCELVCGDSRLSSVCGWSRGGVVHGSRQVGCPHVTCANQCPIYSPLPDLGGLCRSADVRSGPHSSRCVRWQLLCGKGPIF